MTSPSLHPATTFLAVSFSDLTLTEQERLLEMLSRRTAEIVSARLAQTLELYVANGFGHLSLDLSPGRLTSRLLN